MSTEEVVKTAGLTPTEYISEHLQNLNSLGGKQTSIVDFSVINLDTVFWSLLMGLVTVFVLWLAARKAASETKEIKEFFKRLKNNKYPTKEDTLDIAYPYCQWNELLRGFGEQHYYPQINSNGKMNIFLATYYLPNHFDYITQLRGFNNE